MRKLVATLALSVVLAGPVHALGEDGPISAPSFMEGMCAICSVASYSPACFVCTAMMMWEIVDGW